MKFGKIGVVVIGLIPFNVYGECTPAPDCASIGYTETSCEGDYLACPFDSTKFKCTPCDSSFRYDCSGDNITGGTGSVCGGKYASCECSSTDYIFSNGSCVCDTSCKVGAIYYSDGSCSSCVDTTKTAIGVVVKENELVMSNNLGNISWGGYGTNIAELTDYSSSVTDISGKSNTSIIVTAHKKSGLTSMNSAAIFCSEYSTEGSNVGDWYLPALGELSYIKYNSLNSTFNKMNWGTFSAYFWSSTEESYIGALTRNPSNGFTTGNIKNNKHSVTCFLEIS